MVDSLWTLGSEVSTSSVVGTLCERAGNYAASACDAYQNWHIIGLSNMKLLQGEFSTVSEELRNGRTDRPGNECSTLPKMNRYFERVPEILLEESVSQGNLMQRYLAISVCLSDAWNKITTICKRAIQYNKWGGRYSIFLSPQTVCRRAATDLLRDGSLR